MRYKNFDLIKGLVLTEKAFKLGQGGRLVVMKVHLKASKREIKEAIESIFEVKVEKVRVLNYRGKSKRSRTGTIGHRSSYKKAYVTLSEGYSLPLFEQV